MMSIDPEGVFRSRQLRICALCLGDIGRDDQCTYVDDEIACMECAEAAFEADLLDCDDTDIELPEEDLDLDDYSYDYDY